MKKAFKVGADYDSAYYLFPSSFKNMDDFVIYLAEKPNTFVKLTKLSEDTPFPYFIEEESKEVYLRLDQSAELQSVEVTLLKKAEYAERVLKLIDTVCDGCNQYKNKEECSEEIKNLKGHWRRMNLKGYCDSFWRKKENGNDDEY